jgi:hypothetical protein
MTTVKHVLDKKGQDVHFIHPDASVFDGGRQGDGYILACQAEISGDVAVDA